MSQLILPSEWRPSDGIELEDNALLAVTENTHAGVSAGPGAGKTELLAQKAAYLLQTGTCPDPRRILALSYKRDAAKNIADRVQLRCEDGLARRFDSYTFHAFAKGMVDRFRLAVPVRCRPRADYEIVFRNGALPDRVTFDQIFGLATLVLRQNPKILKALRLTYAHVFLDEFQDCTARQYEFLKEAFLGSNCVLTAVGDAKQRIMGWAGALPDAFDNFSRDFQPRQLPIYINHRAAPELKRVQQVIINDIEGRAQESRSQSVDAQEGQQGCCALLCFESSEREAQRLAQHIAFLVNTHGIPPHEIAVLVRKEVTQYTWQLQQQLKVMGVKARDVSQLQDVLTEPITDLILGLLKIIIKGRDRDAWLQVRDRLFDLRGAYESQKLQQQVEEQLTSFINASRLSFNHVQISREYIDSVIHSILDLCDPEQVKATWLQYRSGTFLEETVAGIASLFEVGLRSGQTWGECLEDITGQDQVSLMTIHKCKGLEFDTVFVVGLEDGAFNYKFERNRQEETRTFFVALSRAKQRVYFTFSQMRQFDMGNDPLLQSSNQVASLYGLLSLANIHPQHY